DTCAPDHPCARSAPWPRTWPGPSAAPRPARRPRSRPLRRAPRAPPRPLRSAPRSRLDAHLTEHGEHVLDLLGIDLLGGQHRVDLVMGHVAALLGGADEFLDGRVR